jgi:cold shock CspA family protein
MSWLLGKIKFFEIFNGYGFVKDLDNENEYFIHHSKLKSDKIFENDLVVFKLKKSTKKKGTMEAFDLYLISHFTHDKELLLKAYLEHDLSNFKDSVLKNLDWKGIKPIINKEINDFKRIEDETTYNQFCFWINKIKSLNLSDRQLLIIDRFISIWIDKNINNIYKTRLWLNNVISSVPHIDIISDFFNTHKSLRLKIFSRVNNNTRYLLLDKLLEDKEVESIFDLIKDYIKEINDISEYIEYKDFHNSLFWKNKVGLDFFKYIISYFEENLNEEEKLGLFLKGYLSTCSKEYVLQSFSDFKESKIEDILESKVLSQDEIYMSFEKILINLASELKENDFSLEKYYKAKYPYIKEEDIDIVPSVFNERNYYNPSFANYYWLFELSKKHLSADRYKKFESKSKKTLPFWVILVLWEEGLFKNVSDDFLKSVLRNNTHLVKYSKGWVLGELKSRESTFALIRELLESLIISSKKDLTFFKACLLVLDKLKDKSKPLDLPFNENQIQFNSLINWLSGKSDAFDFEAYKELIVCFSTKEQIQFIRKLFWLKKTGKFDLTIEKLNQITRIDVDIYKLNQDQNPDVFLDISIHVVIEALKSFDKNQKFLLESELLKLVLDNYHQNKSRSFEILNLFDKCDGRSVPKYNFENLGGSIRKIEFNGHNYFSISVRKGETILVSNRRGSYNKFLLNPQFDAILDDVKNIPNITWYPIKEVWGVHESLEVQVMELAKKHRFFLNLTGNKYKDNPHLAEFKRESIPSGITFCEGRLSKANHKTHNVNFWWCCNQPCFENCINTSFKDNWEEYNFLDFCSILGFNLEDNNVYDSSIENSKYYQFLNVINRFNRLLKNLYCKECDEMLYPKSESHFAHYRVVLFNCINKNCSSRTVPVYLHHCLNAKCHCIIDSRNSKKCPNGLYICSNENCGSCCSHKMLETRLDNLKTNNATIPEDLEFKVENKLGHLERAEHYCYKCSNKMTEIDKDIFKCKPCDVTYNLVDNYFERPHRHLTQNPT